MYICLIIPHETQSLHLKVCLIILRETQRGNHSIHLCLKLLDEYQTVLNSSGFSYRKQCTPRFCNWVAKAGNASGSSPLGQHTRCSRCNATAVFHANQKHLIVKVYTHFINLLPLFYYYIFCHSIPKLSTGQYPTYFLCIHFTTCTALSTIKTLRVLLARRMLYPHQDFLDRLHDSIF